ncbi:MAG: NADH:ubiquinone reductase (Na(+)-transporting) subunit A [Verrucomicrobia bacterium]|nr:NADH:ubiquinone reductase (Na(+)-transporting) subunit A [Verrucomicrobiota bacterium]MCH8526235.1 NADH:ubiquinone reductase (Na(+)-transporting) subunit A [Kiritimatiellia bacterium]
MTADFKIKNGLDIPMEGAPSDHVRSVPLKGTVSVFPSEYKRVKFKMLVEEGDTVKQGGVLARRKDQEDFLLRSPVAGKILEIKLGDRRSLQEVVIEPGDSNERETFSKYTVDGLLKTSRAELLALLKDTGMMALIRQRPFNVIADASVAPKSIFVNGMNTAPFRPDAHVLARGKNEELQAGLNALTRLTDGPVHLCLSAAKSVTPDVLTKASNVQVNYFDGPHPSGNTSTHIHLLDPVLPGDSVWTLRVSDVLRIGELLLNGAIPATQTVMIAGNGVKPELRGYVTVTTGMSLASVLDGALIEEETRVIRGDALYGDKVDLKGGVNFYDQGFVVLPEDRERHLLGWYAPTTEMFSAHKVVPSAWVKGKKFSFGTNTRGSKRALVLTGIYDKYVPLDIMVDPLSRACISKDTDDAIALGILETDPEDFALCTFVCPSKTDFGAIVAETLSLIQEEGF